MCGIKKIIKTTKTPIVREAKMQRRGLDYDHIRFNTDVVFEVAKKLELPLDETFERMKQYDGLTSFSASYRNRHVVGAKDAARGISTKMIGA